MVSLWLASDSFFLFHSKPGFEVPQACTNAPARLHKLTVRYVQMGQQGREPQRIVAPGVQQDPLSVRRRHEIVELAHDLRLKDHRPRCEAAVLRRNGRVLINQAKFR
jgi:hypothetical protein